jgi:hypothetical protein
MHKINRTVSLLFRHQKLPDERFGGNNYRVSVYIHPSRGRYGYIRLVGAPDGETNLLITSLNLAGCPRNWFSDVHMPRQVAGLTLQSL